MATTKRRSPGNKAKGPAMIGKGDQTRIRRTLRTHPRVTAFAVGAAFAPWFLGSAFADPAANQLPTGGQIGAGSVTIATAGTKMQIDQASDKAIINWNCFCIGSNAWVNFNQPSASSVVLNRSTQAAEIFGRMSANGQVFVTSGAGVYFGRTAQVDVGSLFASSLSISDQNFLAGRYVFSKDGSAGEVVNEGTIVAVGGYAALAGPQVRNNGIIIAQAGTVALAAGDRVSLDMIGDGLVKVSVDAAALNALALNAGTLQADGGRVVMTARSANALLDTVLNNTGIIRATTLVERKGEIVLDGGDKGIVANSGTVTAAGLQSGQQGGNIVIVGQYVGLWNGTRIDASGDAGGGNVNVGGNFQGQGPLQNASQTIVEKDASIKADAITNGDGGNVVVWSNDATQFYGSISAQGGSQSGNGGNVEVSGKHGLNFQGTVSTLAPNGQTGTLLLDPDDLTIVHSATAGNDSANTTGSPSFVSGDADVWTLTDYTINTTLFTTNVTATTSSTGSITISNASGTVVLGPSNAGNGAPNASNAFDLTLTSAAGISWTSGWTYSNGAGSQLTLNAQAGDITGSGTILITGASPVLMQATTGISATLNGVSTFAATSTTGDVTLTLGNAAGVTVDTLSAVNGISAASGNVSVTYVGAGALTLGSGTGGDITASGNATVVTNNLVFGSGVIDAGGKATIAPQTASTVITVSGGTSVDFDGNAFTVNGNITATSLQIGNGANTGGIVVDTGGFDPAGVGTTLNLTTSGSIDATGTAGAVGGTNITSLAMVAGAGGIGPTNIITTAVDNLAASAAGGGIAISNTAPGGTLTVTTVDGVIGIDSGGTAITLSEQDNLTVSQAINAGAGALGISFGQAGGGSTFTLGATGSLAGTGVTVTGGVGNDTFDFSAAPVATTAALDGAGGTDTLQGVNAANTWTINAGNGGNVASTGTLTFSSMESLTGNANTDSFQFVAGGSVSGTVDGGSAGTNTLDYDTQNFNGAVTVTVSGAGSSVGFAGTANATGGFDNITAVTGDSGFASTNVLAGANVANTWSITGANSGTLNTLTFTNFGNLTGNANTDSFQVASGGSVAGTVDGGSAGTNTLDYDTQNFNGAVTVTVSGAGSSVGFAGTANATGGFDNITAVTGDSGFASTNVLAGANAVNAWSVASTDSGTLTSGGVLTFTNFGNLTGNASTDTFTLAGGTLSGAIVGGTGTDTLTAGNVANTWTINAGNGGSVTGVSGGFTGIENLVGNANTDSFQFVAGGSVSGTVDGGSAGTNTLDYDTQNFNGAVTVTVSGAGSSVGFAGTANATGGFDNITAVTGDSGFASTNVLAGANVANTWSITGANSGTLNTLTFTNFGNLTGNANTDSFQVASGGSVAGTVDGGSAGTNTLDYDTQNFNGAVTVTVSGAGSSVGFAGTANATGGFDNITAVTGDSGFASTNVLAGANVANTWSITGANSGTLNTLTFTNFGNLTGNANTDSFQVASGGSVAGTVDGGSAGTNTLDYDTQNFNGAVTVTVSGAGSSVGFAGTANATGGFDNITAVTGDSGFASTNVLAGANVANTWSITGANSGTLNTLTFTNFGNLTGNANTDSFQVASGGSVAGTVDGGSAGTNTLDYDTQNFNGAVTVTVSGAGSSVGFAGTANATGGFDNITAVTGDSGFASTNVLAGANVANTWSITGANSGTLNTLTFTNFGNLTGNANTDSFQVASGGSVAGTVDGGSAGTNTLDYDTQNFNGAVTVTVSGAGSSVGFAGTANATGGFDNITAVTGDSGFASTNVLAGPNAVNAWSVASTDSGTLTSGGVLTFTNFGNLTGNASTDTFTLAGGTLSGAIVGGTGTDTLTAGNVANTWTINAGNGGSVTGVSGGFTGIENLVGNANTDSFQFVAGGSVSGTVDGGSAGTNTLDYDTQNFNGAVTVTVSGAGSSVGFAGTANATGGFDNITAVTGDSGFASTNVLAGANVANTWSITGANSGTLNTLTFTNFGNLTGNANTDSFQFVAGGSVSGTVDGGSAGTNTLDYDTQNFNGAVTVTVSGAGSSVGFAGTANATGGFDNITAVTGDSGFASTNVLAGPNAVNAWSVASTDSGTLTSGGVLTFTNFGNLTGNASTDTFTLAGGTLSGAIVGGTGTDTLTAGNVANTWTINAGNGGSVTGVSGGFTGIENLVGNANTDSFQFVAGGSVSGTVDGGSAGTNTLDYDTQNFNGAVTVTVSGAGSSVGFAGTANATGGFDNITAVTGDSGFASTNVLAGPNAVNAWSVASTDSGTLTSGGVLTFTNFGNLTGNASTDTFTLAGGTLSGAIVGGTGTDTLTAGNVANTWTINAGNGGSVTGVSGGFTGIENLVGNANADSFQFVAGGSVSGTVDGGSAGTNTLDYDTQNFNGAVTVTVSGAGSSVGFAGTANATGGFDNITAVTGDSGFASTNVLAGANVANTWSITGANSGTLNTLTFTNFGNLTGNANTDSFQFVAGGSVSGTVDGGSAGTNTLDYDTQNFNGAVTVTVSGAGSSVGFAGTANATGGFDNITAVTGDSGFASTNVLAGPNAVNAWSVASTDSGTLTSGGVLTFTNFGNLTGNASTDTFTLAGGTLSGAIVGGTGTDTLTAGNVANTWTINAGNGGSVTGVSGGFTGIENLVGNANTDSFQFVAGGSVSGTVDGGSAGTNTLDYDTQNFNGAVTVTVSGAGSSVGFAGTANATGGFDNITAVTGDSGFASTNVLAGPNAVNAWSVASTDSGTLTSGGVLTFTNFGNLTGNASTDTFTLAGGTLSGAIVGGTGTDTLTAGNVANTWTINAGNGGSVTGVSGGFTGIENLVGNANADSFQFVAGGSVSGTVDGGSAGTNTLDYDTQNFNGAVTVTVSGAGSSVGFAGTANATGGFDNITAVTGDSGFASTNVLAGANVANTWSITGANSGTLNTLTFTNFGNLTGNANTDSFTLAGGSLSGALDGGGAAAGNTLAGSTTYVVSGANSGTATGVTGGFTNIGNLTGTGGADSFTFQAAGTLAGNVDGLGNTDTVDLSAKGGAVTIDLQAATFTGISGTFTSIESFVGNGAGSTIVGPNGGATFSVTGANSGTAAGTTFSQVGNLTGGTGNDTFSVSTGTLTGAVNGGTGADTLDLSGKAGVVAINLQTGAATGVTGGFSSIESVAGNGTNTTLTGPAAGSTYSSSGSNSGSAGATSFSGIGNITTGGGNDTFASLNITGNLIDPGGTVAINGAVSTGGNQTYSGAVTIGAAITISAGGNISFGTNTVTDPGFDLVVTAGGNLTPGTMDVGAGRVQLFAAGLMVGGAGQSVTGTSTQQNVMSSGANVSALNVNFSNQILLLTGAAGQWDLTGPPVVGSGLAPVFQIGNGSITVTYNGTLVSGAAVAAIQQSNSVIGATLAEIARAALLEAQDTDSVQKQIAYGFAGDVGTTPPMDHRIDETGISVPICFNDSREGQTCR